MPRASTNGIELTKNIRAEKPKLPVLVLSMHDETLFAERALRAGARGYVMKREALDQFITAVRTVLEGEIFIRAGCLDYRARPHSLVYCLHE